jgi:hypothetical protein
MAQHFQGPTQYPVACAPQSWSAATVFLLFQACLGLEINGAKAQIYFTRPHLPASLGELRIYNLDVAGATVDLLLVHHEQDVGVNMLSHVGDVQILVVKWLVKEDSVLVHHIVETMRDLIIQIGLMMGKAFSDESDVIEKLHQ